MRRLLFFLACGTVGVGLLILFRAGTGAAPWLGITGCALLVLAGTIGGRWGRGPVARGVKDPQLTRVGLSVVVMCAFAGMLYLWRPSATAGLPVVSFLLCMALGGLLMVPVGLMGDDKNELHD